MRAGASGSAEMPGNAPNSEAPAFWPQASGQGQVALVPENLYAPSLHFPKHLRMFTSPSGAILGLGEHRRSRAAAASALGTNKHIPANG